MMPNMTPCMEPSSTNKSKIETSNVDMTEMILNAIKVLLNQYELQTILYDQMNQELYLHI